MDRLNKIDDLMDRFEISYKDAKDILLKYEWDVINSYIYLESHGYLKKEDRPDYIRKEKFLSILKEELVKGNNSRIIIKSSGDIILNVPVSAGIVGTFISPVKVILNIPGIDLDDIMLEVVKLGQDDIVVYFNEIS